MSPYAIQHSTHVAREAIQRTDPYRAVPWLSYGQLAVTGQRVSDRLLMAHCFYRSFAVFSDDKGWFWP